MNLSHEKQPIAVSSEKIRQQSEQSEYLCEKLLAHMKTIESKVAASVYFWNSESSQLLYKYFDEDKLDYEKIRKNLHLQIKHLNQIAAIYESSEKDSREAITTLPDTIIE